MKAKEKILKLLKKEKQLSTSRIAGLIGIDYVYAVKLLHELEQEKKIKRLEVPSAVYWSLK